MPTVTFTLANAQAGKEIPVAYLVFNSKPVGGSVTPYYWTDRGAAWAGQFIDPRVVSFGNATRSLSDWMGRYESATFDITVSDYDQLIAGLLEGATTKYLSNREAILYLHEDNLRRSGYTPLVVMRGIVRQVDPESGRNVRFMAHDYVTAEFGPLTSSELLPRRLLDATHFTTIPSSMVGYPEPILYGTLAATGGATSYPILPIYTGTEDLTFTGTNPGTVTYCRYLVASHACYAIDDVNIGNIAYPVIYMGNGVIIAPYVAGRAAGTWYDGSTNPSWVGRAWSDISGVTTPYRTFGGRRYTVVYVLPDVAQYAQGYGDGTLPITFNVRGVETVGDGSGTLITDQVLQYEHCVRNFLLGDYQAGAWLSTPTSPISGAALMDSATWTTASGEKSARNGGSPYVGGGCLGAEGDRSSISEWLARWNLSADVFLGFNKSGQLIVVNDTTGSPTVTLNESDIVEGSFSAPVEWDRLANVIPYAYRRDPATKSYEVSNLALSNAASITSFSARKVAARREYWFVRDASIAVNISKQWIRRQKDLPRKIALASGLHALSSVELGDRVIVAHRDGPKSGGAYSATVQITRVNERLDECLVELEGYDLSAQEADPAYTSETLPDEMIGQSISLLQSNAVAVAAVSGSRYMGGSRSQGYRHTAWAPIYEYVTQIVEWNIFSGVTVKIMVAVKCENAATSVSVRVWDVTAGAWDGAAQSSTTVGWVVKTFTLTPSAGDHNYEVWISAGQEDVHDVYAISAPGLVVVP
jgi:hypothetical protein